MIQFREWLRCAGTASISNEFFPLINRKERKKEGKMQLVLIERKGRLPKFVTARMCVAAAPNGRFLLCSLALALCTAITQALSSVRALTCNKAFYPAPAHSNAVPPYRAYSSDAKLSLLAHFSVFFFFFKAMKSSEIDLILIFKFDYFILF